MTDVVVVDCETTGLDPATDRVVEIAAVALHLSESGVWSAGEHYQSLVDPGRDVPAVSSAIHHLTAEDLRGAPALDLALAGMAEKLDLSPGPIVFAAHNVKFDWSFLGKYLATPSARTVCTHRCALHLVPEAPAHGNQALRYHLGLRPRLPERLHPHRALYDAIVTAETLVYMLGDHSVDELVDLSEKPVLLRALRFGKYAGVPSEQVPADYYRWILRSGGFDEDVEHTARHYQRRS